MRITCNVQIVLLGALRDSVTIQALEVDWEAVHRGDIHQSEMTRRGRLKEDLPRIGSPYEPRQWFERPLTLTETASFSRTLTRMEAAGLLVRHRPNGQTTHIRLTDAGEALADDMAAQAGD